ncbi:hypothetical protein CMI47_16620 [Candidatus Pacearchaeota archaeon]|nr:hypothetical protein [Candidatus Pacearchaeota archaeon]
MGELVTQSQRVEYCGLTDDRLLSNLESWKHRNFPVENRGEDYFGVFDHPTHKGAEIFVRYSGLYDFRRPDVASEDLFQMICFSHYIPTNAFGRIVQGKNKFTKMLGDVGGVFEIIGGPCVFSLKEIELYTR